MALLKTIRKTAGLTAILALAGVSSIGANAQDNTITTLDITAGALTMYAADANDNNDLCASGDTASYAYLQDDGVATTNVTCSDAERTVAFSGISVTSQRQNTTSTLFDMLFEDLSGVESATYSVSLSVGDFNRAGGGSIALGSNPDTATDETALDADAPSGADAGKIFAVVNPSGLTPAGITPGPARTDGATLTVGAKTTTIDTSTSIGVFSSPSDVSAGRYELDGTTVKFRVPAFVQAGSYTGSITQTVTAS